ncbi:co-chaperone GroES [soil metagenome]
MAKDKNQKSEGTNMKLRPLQDRLIVRQSLAEEKTASGIVLPDSAKEKPTKGKVIAVGPGKLDDKGKPMELGVRVGDTVYYGKYTGTDVEIDGDKLVILRETDVLGVLE